MSEGSGGVQLAEVFPQRWQLVPFRTLFTETNERNATSEVGEPLSVSEHRGVVPRDAQAGQMASEDVSTYRVVRPGQLAANVMWLDKSGLGVSEHTGYVSPAYKVYDIAQSLHRRFANYLLRSTLYRAVFQSLGRGVRPNAQMVDTAELRAMKVPIPTLAEQVRIADFLDRETAKIDTLIEKQNALIERLRERRESVVVRGVFGADSRTRDLPTLIGEHLALEPLLAMTPAHWQVLRFKACLRRSEARNDDLAQPMMSLKINGQVAPRAALQQEPDAASLPRYLVVNPDELVVNPMWLVGGAVGVSEVSGAVSPDYRVFRVRGKHFPRYLHYLLRTRPCIDQYTLYTRAQTTFDRRVQQPQLDNLPLPVPPLDEQREITEHLDHETAKIDALLAKAERFVEVASERRAALITAGVTGQIDVTKEGAA